MTRSTLLQLLAHPTALTGADVRELEQLAKAFPYCQTAHLLLAKAAHDQGSMLAGQRLRRAATYAADRALLRQLIELPAFAEPVLVAAAAEETAVLVSAAPATAAPAVLPIMEHSEPTVTVAAPEATIAEAESESIAAPLPEPAQLETETSVLLPGPELLTAETPLPEAELPAQAPPIRPPAEAEAARLEFGLAEEEPAELVTYQLPELLEIEEVIEPTVAPAPPMAPPAFDGVVDVGYVPGEGSRLGFCLQSPTAEAYSLTTGPAALLPSTQLPPTGEFFAPDALLLAHLAAYQAAAAPISAPAPVASDLINSFLRRSPQAPSRRRPLPPPDVEVEEQPDLAGPSTRAVPDLASESLAKILARQGKTDRAIAIYERLMVKQPEKTAYFAAQIESLRPPA